MDDQGLRLDELPRSNRQRELEEVRDLLGPGEELPGAAPDRLPHPAASVAAYAGAYGAGVADLVRPLLFRAYWVDGLDIGDHDALRRLLPAAFRQGRRTADAIKDFGYAVTSQHAPITTQAHDRIRQWQQEWLAQGGPVTLTLITDEDTATGHRALRRLGESADVKSTASFGVSRSREEIAVPAGRS